eukprot:TRINITY_DN50462_c0_g1_i1.p3 TRINITY_DN50462_c0_g1~~TRINITY_DN50462_c0_g1_i1.p3  ORF type:complete len:134 (+),score=15.44 TRINITY_DN50462_c0_g1_i1:210-611(+)
MGCGASVAATTVVPINEPEQRRMAPAQAAPAAENPLVVERIRQLEERTRVCSRKDWEEACLPGLLAPGCACGDAATCSICLADIGDDERIRGLACGHAFHIQCIAQWFMRDQSLELCCPLCRRSLSEQSPIFA